MVIINKTLSGLQASMVRLTKARLATCIFRPEPVLSMPKQRKLGLVKRIKKQIDKFGRANEELGIVYN